MQLAFVTTTSDSFRQIKLWIDYHKSIGVMTFYLFVDGQVSRMTLELLSTTALSGHGACSRFTEWLPIRGRWQLFGIMQTRGAVKDLTCPCTLLNIETSKKLRYDRRRGRR